MTFDGSELEFWLGAWDCTWEGGRGSNRVERDFDGKVIYEHFHAVPDPDGTGELRGESWSVFSPRRPLWRQTWVDTDGSYFDMVGDRVDGCFAFVREAPELGEGGRQRRSSGTSSQMASAGPGRRASMPARPGSSAGRPRTGGGPDGGAGYVAGRSSGNSSGWNA